MTGSVNEGMCLLSSVVQRSVCVCVCVTCVMSDVNHTEQLFDSQMYLCSKSMTSDALIILMSGDKHDAGITAPEQNRWMI